MDFLFIAFALAVEHPAFTFGVAALLLLWAIIRFLKWNEGPSPDYDDSETGVGRPL